MDLRTIFGSNLRQHRKAAGMSQEELAMQTDLSREMISRIERGVTAPAFNTIETLAESLGVAEAAFFGTTISSAPDGERGRLLKKMNLITSKMNERELSRATAMLEAMRS